MAARTGTLGRVGWVVLLVTTGVMLLGRVSGPIIVPPDDWQAFLGYAAANAVTFLVVLFAYRRRELWAWFAVWVFVIAVAALIPLSAFDVAAASIAAVAALTLGQALISRDVFSRTKPSGEVSAAELTRDRRIRLRTAGVLSLLVSLGFGIPTVYGAWYFANDGRVWQFLGNPTMGDGPFVRFGLPNSVALMVAFVVVCAAGTVCGVLLLMTRRAGSVMAVALLPIELIFWIGFALPFAFPLGIARTALVLWRSGRSDPAA